MAGRKSYVMDEKTLSRLKNGALDICKYCGHKIKLDQTVVSKGSGSNYNRYSQVYHIECARKLNLV